MKRINVIVSDEVYKIIHNLKTDKELKKLDEAVDFIIKSWSNHYGYN